MVAGSLFGNSPNQAASSAGMHQGDLGDCYLISALGAIADSSPAAIENMIIPNGVENGVASWTVRFYYLDQAGGYAADYVTVNAMLAGYGGCPIFAGQGADGSWWVPLVEKAYAQWNETGREGRSGQNAYASLDGGWMQTVDAQVLGCDATAYYPAADPAAEQAVIAALSNDQAVTAGIWLSGDAARFNQLGLVSSHAYEVAGYDSDPASPTFGTFLLENPWGCDEPTARLAWNDLCAYGWLVVADTSSTVAASSLPAGAAAATAAEVHAAAVPAPAGRQRPSDAALLTYLAGNENLPAGDTMLDPRARALELVLARSGR